MLSCKDLLHYDLINIDKKFFPENKEKTLLRSCTKRNASILKGQQLNTKEIISSLAIRASL